MKKCTECHIKINEEVDKHYIIYLEGDDKHVLVLHYCIECKDSVDDIYGKNVARRKTECYEVNKI